MVLRRPQWVIADDGERRIIYTDESMNEHTAYIGGVGQWGPKKEWREFSYKLKKKAVDQLLQTDTTIATYEAIAPTVATCITEETKKDHKPAVCVYNVDNTNVCYWAVKSTPETEFKRWLRRFIDIQAEIIGHKTYVKYIRSKDSPADY